MSIDGKSLRDLIAPIENAQSRGDCMVRVRSIAYDSRKVEPGGLFAALRGGYSDGHNYLPEARRRGAVACLVDREPDELAALDYPAVVRVPDSRAALASVSQIFYDDPSSSLKLVGITGTDGKTTTSHMLDQVLRSAGISTGLIGTVTIRIGDQPERSPGRQTTPESLETQRLLAEMRDAGVEVAILETSSHGLETHRVAGCLFDIGIVTNITQEHLDFHGTVECYRAAKARLLHQVRWARQRGKLGVAILNFDDPGARALASECGDIRLIACGFESRDEVTVSASEISPKSGGYSFKLRIGSSQVGVHLPLLGEWNISNALAATAAAHVLGLPLDIIAVGLGKLSSVSGRMQPIRLGQPFQVVVDYAHTAPALELVLLAARKAASGRVMVLFGSAGERDIEKRAEMGAIAARYSDYSIFTSEDPRFESPDDIIDMIATGATRSGAIEGVDFDRLEDRATAIERILNRAQAGDVVVLAGKGHERSMLYGAEAIPWNETETARDALRRMGYMESE